MKKILIPIVFVMMGFSFPKDNPWKIELDKLSAKPAIGKKIELLPTLKKSNEKLRVKSMDIILTLYQSISLCDFLANVLDTYKYAYSKFAYDKKGGMAYIIEDRFFDTFSNKSEIVRYMLITVSSEGEWVDSKLLAQGGTYFFKNSEMGGCASKEGANALYMETKGYFIVNKDTTITSSYSFQSVDVNVDDKNNILKKFDELQWNEPINSVCFINADGTIGIKE